MIHIAFLPQKIVTIHLLYNSVHIWCTKLPILAKKTNQFQGLTSPAMWWNWGSTGSTSKQRRVHVRGPVLLFGMQLAGQNMTPGRPWVICRKLLPWRITSMSCTSNYWFSFVNHDEMLKTVLLKQWLKLNFASWNIQTYFDKVNIQISKQKRQ